MKKIGIIGAMALEVEALKAKLEDLQITEKAGMAFYAGLLHGVQVVVVQCGVGKVNAALCVQILSDLFAVTHVINTGIAGSLDAALDIGDLAISTDVMYHDFHVEEGSGAVLLGEVSMCNDDENDNRFYEPIGRFPTV